jgi:dienelactone hydrolase
MAIGAITVALIAAAAAGQNFRLTGPVGDGLLGAGVVAAAIAVLVVPLRILHWLVESAARAWPKSPVGRALDHGVLPILRFAAHPLSVATAFVLSVLVLGREDGPLSLFSALVPFEIFIAAGSLVGLLIGLARGLSAGTDGFSRPRIVGTVLLATAILTGATTGAWALLPGPGDALVREAPAALAAIAQLTLPDPSAPGAHAVTAATYGSGMDHRRPEYGEEVTWTTPTVDASAAFKPPDGIPKLYADLLWGFGTDSLPINGLAWYATDAREPMPVVLIVHGNHAAGDYSDPGYAYLAQHLASRGMFAVSVDENFLNGDAFHDFGGTEMGVRAWLLLRHLEQLRTWNEDAAHSLANRLDLDRVALVGHSRGGEAAALAAMVNAGIANIANMPPAPDGFGIRAVVAMAPSDAMYRGPGSPVALTDIDYLVMQGAHDGDLPWYEGLRTYHRVQLTGAGNHLKVAAYSERANHGRFNSVWDTGDAGPLASWMLDRGSLLSQEEQQRLAKALVGAFLARSLEGQTAYDALFRDPRAGRDWLPDDVLATHWESSARVSVADLGAQSVEDQPITAVGFKEVRRQDPQLRNGSFQGDRAIRLDWDGPASFRVAIDPATASKVDPQGQVVLSLASPDERPIPAPTLALHFGDAEPGVVPLASVSPMRPPLPTRLWKHQALGDRYAPTERIDWPAERFGQTYAVDLSDFASPDGVNMSDLVAVEISFAGEGAAFLDDLAFEPAVALSTAGRSVPVAAWPTRSHD